MTERFDLAIVGGGLIGAVAALGAARRGWRVALIDQAAPRLSRGRLGHDIRNVAISPATRELLVSAGVWDALAPTPYRAMRIRDARGTATMAFDADAVGRTELGWILESSPTVAVLWEQLGHEDKASLSVGSPVTAVSPGQDAVEIQLGDTTLETALLVAADGARSSVRELLGVRADVRPTGHQALVTVVQTGRPHDGVAWQTFLPDGPVALLPGSAPCLSSVVWSQPAAEAERRLALTDDRFCRELGRATAGCLGEIEAVDERFAFPLNQMLAADLHPSPRVLLAGDAAHVLHPLAGLGANLGFEDVRALFAVLDRLPSGSDPGVGNLWTDYARQRRLRARLLVELMASLQAVYSGGGPWRQFVRNTGVRWLNDTGLIKRRIMTEAMGLGPFARGGCATGG